MTATPDTPALDARTRRNLVVLVLAQALIGAQMPLIYSIAGLAGQSLASNPCFATLPISMIVGGSMLTARPMSAVMQRHGRRAGFWIGSAGGAIGGLVGATGIWFASFPLLLLGSLFTGIYMSTQGFFRFAATDTASEAFRPKAISYVLSGGLVAAFIGPQLNRVADALWAVPFLGAYVIVTLINLVGAALFLGLDIPRPPPAPPGGTPRGTVRAILSRPRVAVAMIVAMVSYALMSLMMTSAPLAVVGCGYGKVSAYDVVTSHVLAMFVPSFFTGHLIARFGVERIMATGLTILAAAGVAALSGVTLPNFFLALVLLGIGWNFGFIGATTMLADAHRPDERGLVQGVNDMAVFGSVTLASLASGGLMNCSGGTPVEGWTAVSLAMIPFLTLAGGALIWLWLRPRPG